MEIQIIGAGPSGCIAAISAIRSGHNIEVFEEHERAGYPRHCSGLVSKEGLESISDIVDYNKHVINRIDGATFDFAGEKFEINRKKEAAVVINRAEFDAELAGKAEEAGAKIFYKTRYSFNSIFNSACLHKTQNIESIANQAISSTRHKTIIGADGVLSTVAHVFNFPKIKKFAFTLKIRAKLHVEDVRRVFLFYNNETFPGFFGWLIPHNEYEAEIGVGTTERENNSKLLRKGLEFLMKKTSATSNGKLIGKLIPIAQREKIAGVFENVNVLLVGDAAGQVKSSSGGGVVFGSAGARLAGSLAHSPKIYEQKWKKENELNVLAHRFLQNFFAFQPNFMLRTMAMVSRWVGLDYLFSHYGNMDRPTKIFQLSETIADLKYRTTEPNDLQSLEHVR